MIIDNLQRNAVNAQKVIQETVRRITENPFVSEAHSALKYAILTLLDKAPIKTKENLALLLKKYILSFWGNQDQNLPCLRTFRRFYVLRI